MTRSRSPEPDEGPERVARDDFLVQIAYDVRSALLFLDHVPDRGRAEEMAAGIGPLLIDAGIIAIDPSTPGEVVMPLEFASQPATLARRWFDDATIDAHLDALVATEQDDCGWPINWQIWTPVVGPEWRGWQTVDRLKTLNAYGRLDH